jgi:hypothetical protein
MIQKTKKILTDREYLEYIKFDTLPTFFAFTLNTTIFHLKIVTTNTSFNIYPTVLLRHTPMSGFFLQKDPEKQKNKK